MEHVTRPDPESLYIIYVKGLIPASGSTYKERATFPPPILRTTGKNRKERVRKEIKIA